jgi:DNA-directed RNA polymerase specialized sigma24 family protein
MSVQVTPGGEVAAQADASAIPLSDAELVPRARQGDVVAFEELCRRHVSDAWETAYAVTGHAGESAEAVADTFARVLKPGAASRYGGPQELERALLSAARSAALEAARRVGRTGADAPAGAEAETATVDGQHRGEGLPVVTAAFRSLPERWRSALWLTDVRGADHTEAAAVLGVSGTGLAQLGSRARAGMRERYLHAQLEVAVADGCRPVLEVLGSYAAGSLPQAERATVDEHLVRCDDCRQRLADLDDLGAMLTTIAVPAPPSLLPMATSRWKLAADAVTVAPRGRLGATSLPMGSRKPLAGAALAVMGLGIIGAAVVSGPLLNRGAGAGGISPAAASPTEVNQSPNGAGADGQSPFLLSGSRFPYPGVTTTTAGAGRGGGGASTAGAPAAATHGGSTGSGSPSGGAGSGGSGGTPPAVTLPPATLPPVTVPPLTVPPLTLPTPLPNVTITTPPLTITLPTLP